MENILEIKNLSTYFYSEDSVIKAVEGLNLSVKKGEVLGLVGESACGKTISAYSILRIIQPPGKIVEGDIIFKGKDLLKASSGRMREVRGGEISIIFQEPRAALNPLYTIELKSSYISFNLYYFNSHLHLDLYLHQYYDLTYLLYL